VLEKLTNQALDYAWGSTTLISDYFGIPATGKPMAEIWFGTHDGSPTEVSGSASSLHALLDAQGRASRLPFLLKILAAGAPLSIQAHPNPEQAKIGFARENAAGIPISSPTRNYKDDLAKPELIVALSEKFDALVGFADPRVVIEKFEELQEVASVELKAVLTRWVSLLGEADGIRKVFLETLTSEAVTESLISDLIDAAEQCPSLVDLISYLSVHHGSDRGLASALILNHITLNKGEAVYVPAGMPHAYLSGLGVEVMLASDNVLRGGLTQKHIDVAELTEVLVFDSHEPTLSSTKVLANGLASFDIPTPEFEFYSVSVGSNNMLMDLNLPGDAIVLCVSGALAVSNSKEERQVISAGEAAFISGDARTLSVSGNGAGFIAVSSN
jgi:mannose-6-phosphate isomerase